MTGEDWMLWEQWLEKNHPQIHDRWMDWGSMSDFHPGWEHSAKELLIDEEFPFAWISFQESLL